MLRSWKICLSAACMGALFTLASSAAQAAGFGTLTGQYVFDGPVPMPKPVVMKGDATAKDPAVCAAQDVPDESLVVDAESKGIKDIAIYLRKAPTGIHPDLAKSAEPEVLFDQKGCRFLTHVLFVRTDQKVKCVSSDPVPHNTNITPFSNKAQNFIISPNDQVGTLVAMPLAESRPTQVKCDIHPHMKAYWIIMDHPYVAVTDKDGKFTIEKIPAGKHTFTVWQDAAGYIEAKLEIEIKDGQTTDLGAVKVAPAKFKK